jgi:hypothetical protein
MGSGRCPASAWHRVPGGEASTPDAVGALLIIAKAAAPGIQRGPPH